MSCVGCCHGYNTHTSHTTHTHTLTYHTYTYLTYHTHLQLPSEALDLAIAKLPHRPPHQSPHHHNLRPSSASSSPSHTRRKNRYATVDLYDHPRPFGRVALHEKLLEFISQEWASIHTEVRVCKHLSEHMVAMVTVTCSSCDHDHDSVENQSGL